jgi:hypothetical protein
MSDDKSVIESLLAEAQNYNNFEDIEKLLDNGVDLSVIPIQPLYLSLRNASTEVIAKALPKMSVEQRQSLIDLDLWEKDTLDIYNFYRWPQIYSLCADDGIKAEFSQSIDFLLFVKSRLNVWTFDVEDPNYPDHDYYFLTEDNQLLFEYDKDFPLLDETKDLIKFIYSELGVEEAYILIFKTIVDSQMVLQESCYQDKINRLRDYGFVDYYDSLELRSSFLSYKQIRSFISQKTTITASLDTTQKMQSLHSTAIKAYVGGFDSINEEINKLEDEKRSEYIRFSFIRIVNASISLSNSLKKGIMAISRTGRSTKQKIELGFHFTNQTLSSEQKKLEHGIFELFDFNDLYKIGNSLVELVHKKLRKNIVKHGFDSSNDYFLGEFWERFLDDSFTDLVKVKQGLETKEMLTIELFEEWKYRSNTLCALVPFISQFKNTLAELSKSNSINDQYYLNYTISEVDFEPVILSAFANFHLSPKSNKKKVGISSNDFKEFIGKFLDPKTLKLMNIEDLDKSILSFSKQYALSDIEGFSEYIKIIMDANFTGVAFDKLDADEFKHVGGVLLLA